MKSKFILGIIFIIGILGTIFCSYYEFGSFSDKKEIYIYFNPNKDSTNLVDWERFKSHLPKDFDPNKFMDGNYTGMISDMMRDKIDSIYQAYQKPKRKFINKKTGELQFGIQVGMYEKIFFEYDTLKIYKENKNNKNIEYTLDSIVDLIRTRDFNNYKFYLILEKPQDDTKFISKVTPSWILY
ncbi:hypothetical protein J8L85_03685 [Maribacter sp. MMG018]|uniref:hypothetical protein n=1 Tax=Maribacter sp. MMG018 TaxID=2822688 RepID=UPI001B37D111|nr:hypothetical protein [Maribacter sp. MMG018]MBQ4913523.1 hypothetical protein [Maribacter sp. MMG018]